MKKTTAIIIVFLSGIFSFTAQAAPAQNKTASNRELSISTDPSSDAINITAASNDKHLAFDLYDRYGKKVFGKTFHGNTEKISASQLEVGTYVVIVYSEGNVIRTQKIRID